MKIFEVIFYIFTFSWYGLYFLGMSKIFPEAYFYLNEISFFYKLFIGLILIIIFNPITKTKYTPAHRKIIFTAGIFILTTEGLENIYNKIRLTSNNFLLLPKIFNL